MYTADLAVWLWTILFRGAPCCPYNVGSEDPLSIAQAASAVATGLGSLPAPAISADPIPGRAPLRYVPSTARARSDLSLSVVHSLASAAIKTAEWARVTNPGDHRS
jgi:dTDP-glucose 4,6-dehydratase